MADDAKAAVKAKAKTKPEEPTEAKDSEVPTTTDERTIVNEDGSITIADSETLAAPKKKAHGYIGPGFLPDARYNSQLVAKFINCIMIDGKKSTAERVVYNALEEIANKLKVDPLPVFDQAIDHAKPMVEVRSKRVGGANYQVPVEVKNKRQQTLAIRWILEAIRGRTGQPMHLKLAQELIDCYNKTGTPIQRRENTHRMAEANKEVSHFA
jgi:small subunit ribosomal protein S7